MKQQIVLIHLHPDLGDQLSEVHRKWNSAQKVFEFKPVSPSSKFEHRLFTPGAISEDDASMIGSRIRTDAGYRADAGIIIFTERRLFDSTYYQLFVGGRGADEEPPRVGILSLEFLRNAYKPSGRHVAKFFSAIILNILFAIGTDGGLEDHGDQTRGCIMDFCDFMPDIEVALAKGPSYCDECAKRLRAMEPIGPALLALPDTLKSTKGITAAEAVVTKAIRQRGERYKVDPRLFEYDIALSFSGCDRNFAEELARCLRLSEVNVFYDANEQASLWGQNLLIYLTELYRFGTKCCIPIISANYLSSYDSETPWTRVEYLAALTRQFERGDTSLLPLKLDDTEMPGLLPTIGFIDSRRTPMADIVSMVIQKLGKLR